jgi:hypothetical protein
MKRRRRPARHDGGPALTREERRRFDEIARQIDQEAAVTGTGPAPQTATAIPVRLTMLGLVVIGAAGALTGLATNDLVVIVLAMVGVAATVVATAMFAFAGTSGIALGPPARSADRRPGPDMSLITGLWLRLTTCEENGCSNRPVHLGWCSEHAPAYEPGPDEYWGEYRDGPENERR